MKKVMFKETGCEAIQINVFENDVVAYVGMEPNGSAKVFKLIHMEHAVPDPKGKYGSLNQSSYAWMEEAMNSIRYNMYGFNDPHVAISAMIEHCDYVGETLQVFVKSNETPDDHLEVEICEREYGTLLVNNNTK